MRNRRVVVVHAPLLQAWPIERGQQQVSSGTWGSGPTSWSKLSIMLKTSVSYDVRVCGVVMVVVL